MPDTTIAPRSGGHILAEQLLIHGADTAFGVPGESYLDLLDALYTHRDRFKLINARHEAGAANMAEAYGKLTGKPGICLVTRGPGACQAAVGVHTAFQDSTPMIMLVGQVGRPHLDREAFQEIDYRQMFGPVAKWAAQIDLVKRIPEYISRAFHVAQSGRPGPVVLALPEDMLSASAGVPDAAPRRAPLGGVSPAQVAAVREALLAAEKPLLLLGGSTWTDEACADIRAFAEANGLPVCVSLRRQDAFDNRSDNYVGDFGLAGPPALTRRARDADLLLVIGARLGEITTQSYEMMDAPRARQRLVHIHPDADEIGRVFAPDLALVSRAPDMAAALRDERWAEPSRWAGWREAARADYLDTLEAPAFSGRLDMARLMATLRDIVPADAIVTFDAGNHTGWFQRYFQFGRPGRQLGPTSGAMGYGVPAAVAAAIVAPDRLVICNVGDGGFQMSGLELATAAQHGAAPLVLLYNNKMYGTIRAHQEKHYPHRIVGTDLANPDFVRMAESMGCHAARIEDTEAFLPAFETAVAATRAGRPALLELMVDREQISTRTTIAGLRKGR